MAFLLINLFFFLETHRHCNYLLLHHYLYLLLEVVVLVLHLVRVLSLKNKKIISLLLGGKWGTQLTCTGCKLPWAVWITEFGLLLTNKRFFDNVNGCIFVAVWITDCWLACITDCVWNLLLTKNFFLKIKNFFFQFVCNYI